MAPLRLGVVGCGDIAGYLALVSRFVRRVRLAACCDTHTDRANAFARRFRVPTIFTDYGHMLAEAALDAVYLAVPHDLHAPMIRQAVKAGLPVLVEKPLAHTLEAALALAADVGAHPVGVNYQYRYDRGCYALARALRAGALGEVHAVRINVAWHREADYFEGSPWHRSLARAGGGTLITQASHFLDLALWALGSPPESALAMTASPGFDGVAVETLAQGVVRTAAGTLISVTSSMVADRERDPTIEVYGARGAAFYRGGTWPRVRFSGVRVQREKPPGWGVHALQRSLLGFARWVQDGVPYLTPLSDALPVMAALDALYASAASGSGTKISYQ